MKTRYGGFFLARRHEVANMYVIQGILIRTSIAVVVPAGLQCIALGGGYILIPLGTQAREQFDIPYCPITDDGDAVLPESIVGLCVALSTNDCVAYLEAESFGGPVLQASALFDHGSMVAPVLVDSHAINAALRYLGVVAPPDLDEFDTVGLGRHRDTDQWLPGAT